MVQCTALELQLGWILWRYHDNVVYWWLWCSPSFRHHLCSSFQVWETRCYLGGPCTTYGGQRVPSEKPELISLLVAYHHGYHRRHWHQVLSWGIGSFTVAIFGYFLATFWSPFWLLFVSLAGDWSKSEWKGDQNGVKNGYCETPRMKNRQKGMQNAFYLVSSSPRRIQTPPQTTWRNFFHEFITRPGHVFESFTS